jgi:uncharacterized membrane protein YdfJ with MMPL/SSD domain
MQKKRTLARKYARSVVKAVGLVFTMFAIAMFGFQVLQTVGLTLGTGWLVLFLVGVGLWIIDSVWEIFEYAGKPNGGNEEHSESSK